MACDALEAAGIAQYEISNFARPGFESRHNLKYWTRQPYLGFGVDAHSMLASVRESEAVRFATADVLEKYVAGSPLQKTFVSRATAREESFFLGLRLNRGVDLREIAATFGPETVQNLHSTITELTDDGLVELRAGSLQLTSRGRLFSNEVFQRFIAPAGLPAGA